LALLAVVMGIAAGLFARGSLRNLINARFGNSFLVGIYAAGMIAARFEIRWSFAMMLIGMAAFVVFAFSNALPVPGMAVVGLGLLLNLVISANNGGMPYRASAVVSAGAVSSKSADLVPKNGIMQHAERSSDQLMALADVIPLRPLREVVSVGDVLVALGMGLVAFSAVAGSITGVHSKNSAGLVQPTAIVRLNSIGTAPTPTPTPTSTASPILTVSLPTGENALASPQGNSFNDDGELDDDWSAWQVSPQQHQQSNVLDLTKWDFAETNGADTNGAETNGVETNRADTNGADTNGADTNGADTNGAEIAADGAPVDQSYVVSKTNLDEWDHRIQLLKATGDITVVLDLVSAEDRHRIEAGFDGLGGSDSSEGFNGFNGGANDDEHSTTARLVVERALTGRGPRRDPVVS
jgi:Family of unknown function (DUF5317)